MRLGLEGLRLGGWLPGGALLFARRADPSGEIGLDWKMIVDCLRQVLLCAEVAFRGLNGGVAEQKLDLLQVAAGQTAKLGAGAAEIVCAEVLDPDLLR